MKTYREAAAKIAVAARESPHAYGLLTELCDDVGARPAGSKALTKAITWAETRLREAGHERVASEPVQIPVWERGTASLALRAPVERTLQVMAIGGSVATPKKGIEAEVVLVRTPAELDALGAAVKGKIVLFDVAMPTFDEPNNDAGYGVAYWARAYAASMAAKHGASAVLVRSLTANSLGTLHTGSLFYKEDAPQIPAASVTVEDSAFLARLLSAKKTVRVALKMSPRMLGDMPSANVVAELRGREKPDEIVVIGGHIDSWDVGQGAHDDGAGVVISMEALGLLRRLGLTPRRTIRVVLFTNEEAGTRGAQAYAKAHANEKHVFAVESDSGAGKVLGLGLDSEDDAREPALKEAFLPVLSLLSPLGVREIRLGHAGVDVTAIRKQGAVALGLGHDQAHYFDFHHSESDTLDKVDPEALNQGVATMATLAYVLADLEPAPQ